MPSTDPSATTGFLQARPVLQIDGEEREDLGDAVTATEVHLPLHGRGHAEIHLVDWANGRRVASDLALGTVVSVLMGDASAPVFSGEITGIEERYGDGAPQLVVLAEDPLHRLGRQRHNRRFEAMTLDAVFDQILPDAGLQGDTALGTANATWLQMNESSLAFLMRLASAQGIGLRMHAGMVRAKAEEEDSEPIHLDPDTGTAKTVRIIADLNHQPSSITVRGHDLATGEPISHTVTALTPAPSGPTATAALEAAGWQTESILPHPFARSQSEAEAIAEGQFARAASRFLHG
ncbi:MAG: contractile injection system protein, VgrG/Pvc8 family, partial [Pseudomonadota bacterium]